MEHDMKKDFYYYYELIRLQLLHGKGIDYDYAAINPAYKAAAICLVKR